MARSLLVLGGSAFVGRTVVTDSLQLGWEVTTFNRGLTGEPHPDARTIIGDRRDPEALAQIGDRDWDLVLDTWSGSPNWVRESSRVLRDRAERYAYISSVSVYRPPPPLGVTESSPTVTASPDADAGSYPELKRGAEIAVAEAFPGRSLLARAGLILGPLEDVGRLTWWLSRMARGGEILCPGPRDMAIQYIDARDLARFVITASAAGHAGAFNVVSRPGHATIGTLLDSCRATAGAGDAAMTWVEPASIAAAGIEPWVELPIWIPPDHEYAGLHAANVERAHQAGLKCRPVSETVSDTWDWLCTLDIGPPARRDLPIPGVDPDRERAALSAWHTSHP